MENYTQNTINQETSAPQDDFGGISLRDIWFLVINNWKWFVLSATLFLLAGTFYFLRITPTYVHSAKVLIKEDGKKSSPIKDVSSSFSDMGIGLGRVNVSNEIINFQSPDLMLEVVRNLDLDVNYSAKGRFHDYPLYGSNLPISVKFLSLGFNEGASLKVHPSDADHVFMDNFVYAGVKDKETVIRAAYGDTVVTPVGSVIVSKAVTAGRLTLKEPIKVNRVGYRAAAANCSARLSASLSEKLSTVIVLSYRDVSIERADDVLWMVINVYNENWIKDKNVITTSTNQFISERLRIIEQELGSVDKTITSFRSTHRLTGKEVATPDLQISTQYAQKLVDLNNQMSIARMLRADIMNAPAGTLLPANVGLNDGSTQSQISMYNNGTLQRSRLVENSSEENLLVKDLDGQLAALRENIIVSLDTYMRSLDVQIASAQKVQLASDARVSDIPLQAGEILSDERQQKVKEALYLFLLQKREENELSQAFTAYNTRMVASPGGSSAPVAPNRKMILLIALALGLALPFGYFYLREALNTTVRGRKDLENMNVPFVGELPSIAPRRHFHEVMLERLRKKPQQEEETRELVVKPHSRNVINEAFRVVRTNLEFMHGKDGGSQVIMITSFNVGSGKTFVSSNLSAAMAIKHRKVLAIDMDLRKRTLSIFAGKPKKGITDYLSGKTDDYASLIVKNIAGTTLDILPVGMIPPNPAELLSEPRLGQMIEQLRGTYDYIFLDCPPIEIVTDADVVAPLADTSLFIVRAGLLERSMLPQIDKYYASKRYNNICILLNGTEGAGHYGYRYGYKYGYAYGKYGHYGHYGHYGYGYGYGSHSADTYYGAEEEKEETQDSKKA